MKACFVKFGITVLCLLAANWAVFAQSFPERISNDYGGYALFGFSYITVSEDVIDGNGYANVGCGDDFASVNSNNAAIFGRVANVDLTANVSVSSALDGLIGTVSMTNVTNPDRTYTEYTPIPSGIQKVVQTVAFADLDDKYKLTNILAPQTVLDELSLAETSPVSASVSKDAQISSLTLTSGTIYNTIEVSDEGVLNIPSGTYYINVLSTGNATKSVDLPELNFQVVDDEPIIIYCNTFRLTGNLSVTVTGGDASNIFIYASDNLNSASAGPSLDFYGTIVVPNGMADIGFNHTGQVIAKQIRLLQPFSFMPFSVAPAVQPTNVRYVDASAPAGGDGLSWATAYKYLQDAFADVNNSQLSPAVVEIRVAEGIYYADQGAYQTAGDRNAYYSVYNNTAPEISLLGGFPQGGGELADRNPGQYAAILDGDIGIASDPSDNSKKLLSVQFSNSLLIDGFIFKNVNGTSCLNVYSSGSPRMNNCQFIQNELSGSCVQVSYSAGDIELEHCLFSGNHSTGAGGGVMVSFHNDGFIMQNSTFENNSADGAGGGIYIASDGPSQLISCSFDGNEGSVGGAVAINANDEVLIQNSTFFSNRATDGGAIHMSKYPKITPVVKITNSLFAGNKADSQGGAIFHSATNLQLYNSTITENYSVDEGPGIYFRDGYFRAGEVLTVVNSIVWANETDAADDEQIGSVLNRHNLYYSCVPDSVNGNNNVSSAPMFLADGSWDASYSSWTQGNYAINDMSPCKEAGDPALSLSEFMVNQQGVPVDLAGNQRVEGIIDIGAYENASQTSHITGLQVMYKESVAGNRSNPMLYVQNGSSEALRNYSVHYYLNVTPGIELQFQNYQTNTYNVDTNHIGGYLWEIILTNTGLLGPGEGKDKNDASFAYYFEGVGTTMKPDGNYSYIDTVDNYVENQKIVIKDSVGTVIYGYVPTPGEIEGSFELLVMSKDAKNDLDGHSEPIIYVENTGTIGIEGFYVCYYFTIEPGKTLAESGLYSPSNVDVTYEPINDTSYIAKIDYSDVPLAPGQSVADSSGFMLDLHYTDWSDYNKENDYSYISSTGFAVNDKIVILDKNGNIIWGTPQGRYTPQDLIVTNTENDGRGSLRFALAAADSIPGFNTITFAIPGYGPQTIVLDSELPAVADYVHIDATTQGSRVIVDGGNLSFVAGLTLELSGADSIWSTVEGIDFTRFEKGIAVAGSGLVAIEDVKTYSNASEGIEISSNADSVIIRNCEISQNNVGIKSGSGNSAGVNIQNSTVSSNLSSGIHVLSSANATVSATRVDGNGGHGITTQGSMGTSGDIDLIDACVIVGNAGNGVNLFGCAAEVRNNKIGVESDLLTASGNAIGLYCSGILGETITISANVIGGNRGDGIYLVTVDDAVIMNNYIGTASNNADLGNGNDGVHSGMYARATVGGDNSSSANIIGFNAGDGVYVWQGDVKNNYIGVASDYTDIGNLGDGISSDGNLFMVRGNYIGFNENGLVANVDSLQSNYIGADGSHEFGNDVYGVSGDSYRAIESNIIGSNASAGVNTQSGLFLTKNLFTGVQTKAINNNSASIDIPVIETFEFSASGLTVTGTSSADARVELFKASGNGEDAIAYFTETLADASGNWSVTISATDGWNENEITYLTATATNLDNKTSELADVFRVPVAVYDGFVVINENDRGFGSLRSAIEQANAKPGMDKILFSIPGTGPFTIELDTQLPAVAESCEIDGFSQGTTSSDAVVIDGNKLTGTNGLQINASSVIVSGLGFTDFENAVAVANSNNVMLSGLTIENVQTSAIYFNTVSNSTITNIHASNSGQNAVHIIGSNNLLENLVIDSNNLNGIYIENGDSNEIANALISGSTEKAIALNSAQDANAAKKFPVIYSVTFSYGICTMTIRGESDDAGFEVYTSDASHQASIALMQTNTLAVGANEWEVSFPWTGSTSQEFVAVSTDADGNSSELGYYIGDCFTVTTNADEGEGSLRAAIECANFASGNDVIRFAIAEASKTIELQSPLPAFIWSATIDGSTQADVSLSGASSSVGRAMSIAAAEDVTVNNLEFAGFETAIAVTGNGTQLLSALQIHDVDTGVVVDAFTGSKLTLANSGIADAGVYGMDIRNSENVDINNTVFSSAQSAIGVNNSQSVTIDGVTAKSTASNAIVIDGADDVTLTNSRVESTSANAVVLGDSENIALTANHLSNSVTGLSLSGLLNSVTVSANEIVANAGAGISASDILDASTVSISANFIGLLSDETADGNGGAGILLESVNNIQIASNAIANNATNGIELLSGTGNTFTQNKLFSNAEKQIHLEENASGWANNSIISPMIYTQTFTAGETELVVKSLNSNDDIELYFAGDDESQGALEFIQTLSGDGTGSFSATLSGYSETAHFTVISIDADGNTSELGFELGECLTVTTDADQGVGSLRRAIECANFDPDYSVITFDFDDGATEVTLRPQYEYPSIYTPVYIDVASSSDMVELYHLGFDPADAHVEVLSLIETVTSEGGSELVGSIAGHPSQLGYVLKAADADGEITEVLLKVQNGTLTETMRQGSEALFNTITFDAADSTLHFMVNKDAVIEKDTVYVRKSQLFPNRIVLSYLDANQQLQAIETIVPADESDITIDITGYASFGEYVLQMAGADGTPVELGFTLGDCIVPTVRSEKGFDFVDCVSYDAATQSISFAVNYETPVEYEEIIESFSVSVNPLRVTLDGSEAPGAAGLRFVSQLETPADGLVSGLRNITITNFENGVVVDEHGLDVEVYNITSLGNTENGLSVKTDGHEVSVLHSSFIENGASGMQVQAHGTGEFTVVNNRFEENAANGLEYLSGAIATIAHNKMLSNGANGLLADSNAVVAIVNANVFGGNSADGLHIEHAVCDSVINNRIGTDWVNDLANTIGIYANDIETTDGSSLVIENNVVVNNTSDGIKLDSLDALLQRNYVGVLPVFTIEDKELEEDGVIFEDRNLDPVEFIAKGNNGVGINALDSAEVYIGIINETMDEANVIGSNGSHGVSFCSGILKANLIGVSFYLKNIGNGGSGVINQSTATDPVTDQLLNNAIGFNAGDGVTGCNNARISGNKIGGVSTLSFANGGWGVNGEQYAMVDSNEVSFNVLGGINTATSNGIISRNSFIVGADTVKAISRPADAHPAPVFATPIENAWEKVGDDLIIRGQAQQGDTVEIFTGSDNPQDAVTFITSIVSTSTNWAITIPKGEFYNAGTRSFYVATATGADGKTSELSEQVIVAPSGINFYVINTNDEGTGSLREAITLANDSAVQCNIYFEIPYKFYDTDKKSYPIQLYSPLPVISTGVSIKGESQFEYHANNVGTPSNLKSSLIDIESLFGNTAAGFEYNKPSGTFDSVIVRGLNFKNFKHAILTTSPANVVEIDSCQFENSHSSAVVVEAASNLHITKSKVDLCFGNGIKVSGSNNVLIDSVEVSDALDCAIAIENSTNVVIDTVSVIDNTSDGICISGSNGVLVHHSTLEKNAGAGIVLNAVSNTLVDSCYVGTAGESGNMGNGMIVRNLAVTAPDSVVLRGNYICESGANGILVENSSGSGLKIAGNFIGINQKNDSLGNRLNGVVLDLNTTGIVLRKNNIVKSEEHGILVNSGDDNVFTQNRIVNSFLKPILLDTVTVSPFTWQHSSIVRPSVYQVSHDGTNCTVTLNSPYGTADNPAFELFVSDPLGKDAVTYLPEAVFTLFADPNLTLWQATFPWASADSLSFAATVTFGGATSELGGSCLVVNSTADAGMGSLRHAIGCANYDPDPSVVLFDIYADNKVIALESQLPDIYTPITIWGDDNDHIEVDGAAVTPHVDGFTFTRAAGSPADIIADIKYIEFIGFAAGVKIEEYTGVLLEEISARNNAAAVEITGPAGDVKISKAEFSENTVGLKADAASVTKLELRDSKINENTSHAVSLSALTNSSVTIAGNEMYDNLGNGIDISDCTAIDSISANKIGGNAVGIKLSNSTVAALDSNFVGLDAMLADAAGNSKGMVIDGCDDIIVRSNTVVASAGNGLELKNSSNLLLDHNYIGVNKSRTNLGSVREIYVGMGDEDEDEYIAIADATGNSGDGVVGTGNSGLVISNNYIGYNANGISGCANASILSNFIGGENNGRQYPNKEYGVKGGDFVTVENNLFYENFEGGIYIENARTPLVENLFFETQKVAADAKAIEIATVPKPFNVYVERVERTEYSAMISGRIVNPADSNEVVTTAKTVEVFYTDSTMEQEALKLVQAVPVMNGEFSVTVRAGEFFQPDTNNFFVFTTTHEDALGRYTSELSDNYLIEPDFCVAVRTKNRFEFLMAQEAGIGDEVVIVDVLYDSVAGQEIAWDLDGEGKPKLAWDFGGKDVALSPSIDDNGYIAVFNELDSALVKITGYYKGCLIELEKDIFIGAESKAGVDGKVYPYKIKIAELYPNPIETDATLGIEFSNLDDLGTVTIEVYDESANKVPHSIVLPSEWQLENELAVPGADFSSGIYYYLKIDAGFGDYRIIPFLKE